MPNARATAFVTSPDREAAPACPRLRGRSRQQQSSAWRFARGAFNISTAFAIGLAIVSNVAGGSPVRVPGYLQVGWHLVMAGSVSQ
jgi:hypothetical protein